MKKKSYYTFFLAHDKCGRMGVIFHIFMHPVGQEIDTLLFRLYQTLYTILISFYPSILLSFYSFIIISFYTSICLTFLTFLPLIYLILSFYPCNTHPSIHLTLYPSIHLTLYH